jgi:hypothetical protein
MGIETREVAEVEVVCKGDNHRPRLHDLQEFVNSALEQGANDWDRVEIRPHSVTAHTGEGFLLIKIRRKLAPIAPIEVEETDES